MPMPDAMTAALQRAAAREAETMTYTEIADELSTIRDSVTKRVRELEGEIWLVRCQLAEAIARAEFAEDQCEVAIKDRDHAERRLVEAREALKPFAAVANTPYIQNPTVLDSGICAAVSFTVGAYRRALAASEQNGG